MSQPEGRTITELDLTNPRHVQLLVDRGWAWKSGPKTTQDILKLIISGDVKRKPEKEPLNVKTYLDKFVPAPSDLIAPEGLEPVEEPPLA